MKMEQAMKGLAARMPADVARRITRQLWFFGHGVPDEPVKETYTISIFSRPGHDCYIERIEEEDLETAAQKAYAYAERHFKKEAATATNKETGNE